MNVCSTGRFYFQRLVEFMCAGHVEGMILAHHNAIQHWRALMGPTKPYVAQIIAPHTIRGSYGLTDTRNSTHGSGESSCALKRRPHTTCESTLDSEQSAEREINVMFPEFSLGDWYKNQEVHYRNGNVTFCDLEQVHKVIDREKDSR